MSEVQGNTSAARKCVEEINEIVKKIEIGNKNIVESLNMLYKKSNAPAIKKTEDIWVNNLEFAKTSVRKITEFGEQIVKQTHNMDKAANEL